MLTLLLWGGVIIPIVYYFFIKPFGYWKERGVEQAELPSAVWDNFSPFFRIESFAHFDKRIYNRFKHLRNKHQDVDSNVQHDHHDQQFYPNPDKFDPKRFNEVNKPGINPYTYYPFGLGPRNCIGSRFALMGVKTLYYYLLMSFEIVPTEKTPIPAVISKKKSINLSLEGGFHVGLKRIRF